MEMSTKISELATATTLSESDDIVIVQGGVTKKRKSPVSVDASGNVGVSTGIYLGGTATANLLSLIAQGEWTPLVEGTATAGVGTYTTQEGRYSLREAGGKKFCKVSVNVTWTAHTGSGNMWIKNLPKTPRIDTPMSVTPKNLTFVNDIAALATGDPAIGIHSYASASPIGWQALDIAGTLYIEGEYEYA